MILVTGGTGLIGSHLLLRLTQKGENVRAIYREDSKKNYVKTIFSYYTATPHLLFDAIEWIKADITDIPSLDTAFKNSTYVYHCAGYISFDPNTFSTLKKINIEGTANIVNLCISNAIKKLCYVSSIATLGATTTKTITEDTHWNPEANNSVYAISKYGGEMEVWRASREGLDIVIVNPGVVLGPGFWNSGSGLLFSRIGRGLNYYFTGTTGYVSVNDAVTAMIMLMVSPIKNKRYILVGEHFNFKILADKIAYHLQVKAPYIKIKPYMLQIAWRIDLLKHLLLRTPRALSKTMADTILNTEYYSSAAIKRDLNFEFNAIDDSIETACAIYLKETHGKDLR